MAGITSLVRRALNELGPEAPDVEVQAYVRAKEPSVPDSQVGLALRKIRGAVVPANKDLVSPTHSSGSMRPSCPNCKQLEYKLFVALHYLGLLDGPGLAHGFDYKPSEWDLTAQQLIRVLHSDDAYAALKELNPTKNYTPQAELFDS